MIIMIRILLSFLLGSFVVHCAQAKNVADTLPQNTQSIYDTLYYDRQWYGVEMPAFATYYRIIPAYTSEGFRKPFRDYYIAGGVYREGYYASIDKFDDSKSVMEGEVISYYKSGKTQRVVNYANGAPEGDFVEYFEDGAKHVEGKYAEGTLDGEYLEYYEDGALQRKMNFANGEPDGEYVEYYKDGLTFIHEYFRNGQIDGIQSLFFADDLLGNACMQIEYGNGSPAEDYMIVSNEDGLYGKVGLDDNSLIFEAPTSDNKMEEYIAGASWLYYNYNGILIGLTNSVLKDYGDFYKCDFIIANNTICPLDFDPTTIIATVYDKKHKGELLGVYCAEDRQGSAQRRNSKAAYFGLAETLAAVAARYAQPAAATESGNGAGKGSPSASRNGRFAKGSLTSDTNYGANTKIKGATYNSAAAYQSSVIENEKMAAPASASLSDQKARDIGCLKITTINPGESIRGYVNVEKKKGVSLTIEVYLNNTLYSFPWNLQD